MKFGCRTMTALPYGYHVCPKNYCGIFLLWRLFIMLSLALLHICEVDLTLSVNSRFSYQAITLTSILPILAMAMVLPCIIVGQEKSTRGKQSEKKEAPLVHVWTFLSSMTMKIWSHEETREWKCLTMLVAVIYKAISVIISCFFFFHQEAELFSTVWYDAKYYLLDNGTQFLFIL